MRQRGYTYLFAENIGSQATYHIDGSIQITQELVHGEYQWFATASVSGQTLARALGEISWYGDAQLVINHQVVATHNLEEFQGAQLFDSNKTPIGNASFSLPSVNEIVQLNINVGYNFSNEQGNGTPSMSHLTFTLNGN